jgi:hypothetical protein
MSARCRPIAASAGRPSRYVYLCRQTLIADSIKIIASITAVESLTNAKAKRDLFNRQ